VVENRDFFIPFAFDAPVRAVPFGMEKRMVDLPDGEKNFDDTFSRFDRIPACARRTDICRGN